jgi:hypothetical protein
VLVLVNHFKGKLGDGNAKPLKQATRVKEIVEARLAQHPKLVVLGDLNDTPNSTDLAPLRGTKLKDISTSPHFQDGGFPGTFGTQGTRDKIDYLLLSPALMSKVTDGGIFREGVFSASDRGLSSTRSRTRSTRRQTTPRAGPTSTCPDRKLDTSRQRWVCHVATSSATRVRNLRLHVRDGAHRRIADAKIEACASARMQPRPPRRCGRSRRTSSRRPPEPDRPLRRSRFRRNAAAPPALSSSMQLGSSPSGGGELPGSATGRRGSGPSHAANPRPWKRAFVLLDFH